MPDHAAPSIRSPVASGDIAFSVERVRIDEEGGHCLISGADDEEEPAGYFIVEIDGTATTLEILGEELSQRDGVAALEIGSHHLVFDLEAGSRIGRWMPCVRIASVEAIGTAVAERLAAAFGTRVTRVR